MRSKCHTYIQCTAQRAPIKPAQCHTHLLSAAAAGGGGGVRRRAAAAVAGPVAAVQLPPAELAPEPVRAAGSAGPASCRPAAAGRGQSAGRTGWTRRVHWPRGGRGKGRREEGLENVKVGGTEVVKGNRC